MKVSKKISSVVALVLLAFSIHSCAEPENNSSQSSTSTSSDDGGNTDDGGSSTDYSISFKLSGAESVLATTELGTQTSRTVARSVGEGLLNEFYFSDGTTEGDRELRKWVRASRAARGVSTKSGGATNLFMVDADGNMSPVISADVDIIVLYTLLSKDGKNLFIALDPGYDKWGGLNWNKKNEPTRKFIAKSGCAFFKVEISTGTYSCVETKISPQPLNSEFKNTVSDGNMKPLQLDKDGNLYYIAKTFGINSHCQQNKWDEDSQQDICVEYNYDLNWDHEAPKILRKYSPSGTIKDLTPDNDNIGVFKVMSDGSLAYTGTATNSLKLVTFDSSGTASTNKLTDGYQDWWGSIFFTTDDSGTVMFGSNSGSWGNKGLQFARKHPVVSGARLLKQLNTSLFSNRGGSAQPSRIMNGDDGYVYSLFVENQGYWDESAGVWKDQNMVNLYKVLPYQPAPKVSLKVGSNWWDALNNMDMQISKGYVYYSEKENHPAGLYQPRSLIKIRRLSDGNTQTVLNNSNTQSGYLVWDQRYDVYNWKLNGNTLTFSAFDTTDSTVVLGEIDTKRVRQGKPLSEYLIIEQVGSALGANAVIKDIEIMTPQAPAVDTGSNPTVIKTFTNQENLYSASIEFSKYMNNKDVSDKVQVYEKDNESIKVANMALWIYKTMHLILDTDESVAETKPLKNTTKYVISLPQVTYDRWDWELPSVMKHEFTTVPSEGWYPSQSEVIDNLTDGNIAKYVSNNSGWKNSEYLLLLDNISDGDTDNISNMQIDFSYRFDSNNWQEMSFIIKDANVIDYNRLDWSDSYYTDGTYRWVHKCGYNGKSGGKYDYFFEENWNNTNGRYLTAINNSGVSETWIEKREYRTDGTYVFINEWDSKGEKIIKYDNESMVNVLGQFRRVDGYRQRCDTITWNEGNSGKWEGTCNGPGAKYRWHSGEDRNIDNYNDILDWSDGEYLWVNSKYYVMDNATGETTQVLALDSSGNEIENYHDFVKVDEGYVLQGGDGTRVSFSLHVSVPTYETDMKRVDCTYYKTNDNSSYVDSSNIVVNSILDAESEEWQSSWTSQISQAAKDNATVANQTRQEDEYIMRLQVNKQNIRLRHRTAKEWQGWGNNEEEKKIYSNGREANGLWFRVNVKILDGKLSVNITDDQGDTRQLFTPRTISLETRASTKKFQAVMELNNIQELMLDDLSIISLDSNLNEISGAASYKEDFLSGVPAKFSNFLKYQ